MAGRSNTETFPSRARGFTIVELLIVIVVIAILAAIVIIAYTGIQNKAHAAAAQSAATDVTKLLGIYNTTNGTYPSDLTTVNNGQPMPTSGGTTYAYHPGTGNSSYCVTVTNSNSSYKVTDTAATPVAGGCPGDGVGGVAAITNLIANPSFEASTSGWTSANSATFATSTDFAYSGTNSMKITPSTSTYSGISFANPGTIGTQYTYSAYVYSPTSQSINFAADNMGINTAVTIGPSWQRIVLSGTVSLTNHIYVRAVSASAPIFYVDGVMFTQGPTAYTYADGNTPNWIWTGTANNSTSTGPPQ